MVGAVLVPRKYRDFDDWYDRSWWAPLWPLWLGVPFIAGVALLAEWAR
jgi:hypothetical protein